MKNRRIVVMAFGLMMAVAAWAQTRIVVLSDTHVMGPGLIVNDGPAWQNELAGDRKLLDYSQEVFDVLIETMLSEMPDMLLITGDLTKDGELLSHQYVAGQLDRLREAGIKTFVIPGNHDFGTRHALVFDGDQKNRAEVVSQQQFTELYRHHGYGPESLRDEASLSYCCEPFDSLMLIGIDSGYDGRLAESTLQWVCQQASRAQAQGKRVLAMMHHALFPHFNAEDMVVPASVVKDYETVRNRLADAGIQVVLTGHIHISDIAKDYNADLSRPVYDISTGSVVSYPCDYRRLQFSQDLKQLSVTTTRITTLPNHPTFGTTAKDRLQQFLKDFVKKSIKNDMVASVAANALMVHAEGNENESEEASNIMGTFQLGKLFVSSSMKAKMAEHGLSWDLLETIVTSIMTDTSNYGVEGRQDQTNDLTLTIE
ncbi:MAG: metallophosphoesterase [Prevotella sp.]|nr:metallophosphoesterase [Prevotella sp.]